MTTEPPHWALPALIGEDWLKSVGFKWHQLGRVSAAEYFQGAFGQKAALSAY
jgi:hypothetical protein